MCFVIPTHMFTRFEHFVAGISKLVFDVRMIEMETQATIKEVGEVAKLVEVFVIKRFFHRWHKCSTSK